MPIPDERRWPADYFEGNAFVRRKMITVSKCRSSGFGPRIFRCFSGMMWAAALACGEEAAPSAPPSPPNPPAMPSRERLVSPRMAAMLAAALPKIAPLKPAKESDSREAAPAKNAPPGEPVVMMDPVRVIESSVKRHLLELVEQQQEEMKKPTFTWREGGTILEKGRVTLELSYDPKYQDFKILNLKF